MYRSTVFTVSLLAVAGVTLAPTHAAAAEVSTATCFIAGNETALPPGISMVPSQQHIQDRGMSITCTGRLGDRLLDPSKAGVWDVDVTTGTRPALGRAGGDCLTDRGDGHVTVHLPTADGGMLPLDGPVTYLGVGPAAVLEGSLGQYHFRSVSMSILDPSHLDGNCFTAPLQHWMSAGPLVLFQGD
ncbi:MAG: hypothetical protein JWN03_468 [Nocardia sp.]|uniref:hypothetical protein n=1 Tax=Nocardia sp. TaxID=1821 RepID=UPI0026281D26|nr:hypothetical protein [Nocardia sp.]MCU1640193.1 hypothetical protein [Nocardia sp.]